MDIRCGSCSKLFRVADEKIAGKGVRFKCSRCGETVTVTKDEFELDKLARDEAAVESAAPQAAAAAGPGAATMPPPADQEFQPREYQPPPQSDAGSLGDFDFSEPHAAAAAATDGEGAVMEGGFSFGDQPGLDEQESSAEISISEEDAQAAEAAAFQFPTDIISEPKPLPASKAKSEPAPAAAALSEPAVQDDEGLDLGAALAMPAASAETPKPAPAAAAPKPASPPPKKENDDIDLGAALAMPKAAIEEKPKPASAAPKTGPVFTPPPKSQPLARDEDLDLGSALSMPGAASDEAEASGSSESRIQPSGGTSDADYDGEINPLSSGNVTGVIAGVLCSIPAVLLLTLGSDMTAKVMPVLTALPVLYLAAVAVSGITGLGIMIGLLIAVVHAQTGKRFFFLTNILIGTFFGALFGAGMRTVIALASGAGFPTDPIVAAAIGWGGISFLLGIFVVIARRIMVFSKEETFAAELSTLHKVGLVLSALVILGGLYGEGTLSGRIAHAKEQMAKQSVDAQKKMSMITPDGLTVVNGMAYPDPATRDLVITGDVQNSLDRSKEGWYLEADILDAQGKILATVHMMNGVQLFTQHDRDVLTKRSVNIDQLREKMAQASRSTVLPRGKVSFEMRLYDPPAGAASFLPNLKKFDPAALAGKTAAPGK